MLRKANPFFLTLFLLLSAGIPWTLEEDDALIALVAKHGQNNWNLCSIEKGNRSAKQCHERWQFHLDPNINKTPFSLEERQQIMALHQDLGNRYVKIAERLDSRTALQVKNFLFKKVQHKNLREHRAEEDFAPAPKRRRITRDFSALCEAVDEAWFFDLSVEN